MKDEYLFEGEYLCSDHITNVQCYNMDGNRVCIEASIAAGYIIKNVNEC